MDVRKKLVELSDIQVLQREMECVKRKSATNCSDCLNCDLLMTDERILIAYKNAIDALRNAHGVTVQEWISVKDRLPEDIYGKDREKIVVLVRTKSGNVSQCARCAVYDCSTDATLSQVKWTKNGEFYWSKGKRVTHWMPLPEPPKGD